MHTPVSAVSCTGAALVVLLIWHDAARAGDAEELPANIVSVNPARFALLHFQIDYERVIRRDTTCFGQPIGFHHAHWYPFAKAPGFTANGYGLDFGCRYFWAGTAPVGFFVGPFLSAYAGEVLENDQQTLEGYVFSPGVQAGYTRLFGRLALSAGAGLSYGIATDQAPDGSPRAAQLPHSGVWVNFRANVGVGF